MYDIATGVWTPSDLMVKLLAEKKAANELQLRRHDDWNDNYELYRNRVKTNRLTQRQSVTIPLMKETVKTLLSKIDDPPNIEWQELSGDEEKEVVYQEVWNDYFRRDKLELTDILDKKNVLLYGIGSKKLNIHPDGVHVEALDPFDVSYDPLMKVGNVESARFIVHQNIFRSIREILADERYTTKGKDNLKLWADAPAGLTQSSENRKQWEEKMQRLKSMGVDHADFALYAGGDRLINLTEHFTTQWDTTLKDWQRRVVVYAEDTIELLNEPLKELIGVSCWPFTVWSEDPESQEIYADSIADLVRNPNKIANVWWSQYIENRSLANFGMHWFSPIEGYKPTTYEPGPGRMLPAPPGEDINKVIKPVEIQGLEGTLDAINWLTQIVERGTGATAIEKGEPEPGTQTLGEVELLVGKSVERTVSMAKFYRLAWYELAWKWNEMMHANAPKFLKLYKTSRKGKVYPKRVYAGDWISKVGYEPIVRSTSEQEQESVKGLQKFNFALQQFPNNVALRRIAQKRMLEILDLTPEELKQVEDAEEQTAQPNLGMEPQQPQVQQPQQMEDMSDVEGMINELAGYNG